MNNIKSVVLRAIRGVITFILSLLNRAQAKLTEPELDITIELTPLNEHAYTLCVCSAHYSARYA